MVGRAKKGDFFKGGLKRWGDFGVKIEVGILQVGVKGGFVVWKWSSLGR